MLYDHAHTFFDMVSILLLSKNKAENGRGKSIRSLYAGNLILPTVCNLPSWLDIVSFMLDLLQD